MRPLHLTLEGIHSYRDAVSIDFESLGAFGLFGVFGRIGSGKSTLLDAMTLALYGVVDRVATRSRRGLVHLGSERCEVRFRFLVDEHQAPRTYEVHRAYRLHDGVAQRVTSRLVRLSEAGRSVVAEKELDVNEAVAELIGLGPEDFARAVALPQGRFAQLLHLKGQERRTMLQRIFRLTAYGEGLRRQVRDRTNAVTTRSSAVLGELVGLGDASEGTVHRAAAAAATAREQRDEAERAAAQARLRHDAAARARARRDRVREAQEELSTHLTLEAEHLDAERRLAIAEQERPLLAPARRWLELQRRVAELAVRLEVTTVQAEAATAEERRATLALASITTTRAKREPALRKHLARLEEAVGWELEARAHREEAAAFEDRERAARSAHASAVAAAAAAMDQVKAIDRERRALKKELAKVRVPPDLRERTARAARAADAVATARRLLEEARRVEQDAATVEQGALAAVEDALGHEAAARAAVDAAAAAEPALAEALSEGAREAAIAELAALDQLQARANDRIAERADADAAHERAQRELEASAASLTSAETERKASAQILRGAEAALRVAETQLDAGKRRHSSAMLAALLSPGAPCPVCGSEHHPAPATEAADPSEAAVTAHRTGRERASERHQAALLAHAGCAAGHAAALRTTAAAAERAVAGAGAAEALVSQLTAAGPLRRDDLRTLLEQDRAALQARAQAAEISRSARLTLERAGRPLDAAQAVHAAAARDLDRARAARTVRATEEGECWASFDHERGDLTLFDVPTAVAALDVRARQADAGLEALEQTETTLNAQMTRAEGHRAEAARSQMEAVELRERRTSAAQRADRLSDRITKETAGRTAEAARAEAEAELAALLHAAQTAEAELADARANRERATYDDTQTADASQDAVADFGVASAELEPKISELAWLGPGPLATQVARLLADPPSDEALVSWRDSVRGWSHRAAQLRGRLEALQGPEHDDATAVDDETWHTLVTHLDQAAGALDRARDAATTAQRTSDDLHQKADRFGRLTQEASVLGAESARLEELAQLLRGDRFVEFVANDHLTDLVARASTHLAELTHARYALALDDEGAFVVRDEDAGGAVRPVHTLSGGESFLTALALALALSTQVQARSSRPLGFFFLDEGFGTLDPEALDRVMTAIERLRDGSRLIGVISHVPAVRERVPRYLWVTGADSHQGSRVEMRDS